MKIENHHDMLLAVLDRDEKINSIDDVLDMIGNAYYNGCTSLVVYKESLDESFFDLKTGFAGELLQKFSNYSMKIAIIGDFSEHQSKSLQDFIYECNKGNRVFFKSSFAEGLDILSQD